MTAPSSWSCKFGVTRAHSLLYHSILPTLQRFSHGKPQKKKNLCDHQVVVLDFLTTLVVPRCHILQDLKAHIPILFYEQDFTAKEICRILGIQRSLVYSSLSHFKAYGRMPHKPHVHLVMANSEAKSFPSSPLLVLELSTVDTCLGTDGSSMLAQGWNLPLTRRCCSLAVSGCHTHQEISHLGIYLD